jgi:hypothetical protein
MFGQGCQPAHFCRAPATFSKSSHPDPLRHRALDKFLNCDLAYPAHGLRLLRLSGPTGCRCRDMQA